MNLISTTCLLLLVFAAGLFVGKECHYAPYEEIKKLAAATTDSYPSASIVLYTLAGSMASGSDKDLANICARFAQLDLDRIAKDNGSAVMH